MNKKLVEAKTASPVQLVDGYVPVILVRDLPPWVADAVANMWGAHHTLPDGNHLVLLRRTHGVPPGDWIVHFHYDENEGPNSHELYVAAKVL